MSGKKKYKKRKPIPGAQNRKNGSTEPIRLSQCMIVKNEERNIERALSWARDAAFEQIVVDTGSTDRTVEIAEKMGAKVYHFKWIDDFAAAKNFAIDQASGDWIAFLDADEYMLPEDVQDLMGLLREIHANPAALRDHDAITCAWVQINEKNEQYAVFQQQRIFKNRPDIRYKGRIHELLQITGRLVGADDIRIMHTGYQRSEHNVTGKLERNIRLLREEHEKNPENPDVMIYLADSLKALMTDEANEEAERLYCKALASELLVEKYVKQLAYDFLVPYYTDAGGREAEAFQLCREAIEEYPDCADFPYYLGVLYNKTGDYNAAYESLIQCENAFDSPILPQTRLLLNNRALLHYQLIIACHATGRFNDFVKYATLVLVSDKNKQEVLMLFITVMLTNQVSENDLIELLKNLYDFNNIKDKLFIIRAAKECGAVGFAGRVMTLITDEEKRWMSGGN